MAVPKFKELMLPVLELLADGSTVPFHGLVEVIGARLGLDDADLHAVNSSGQNRLQNRTAWAVTHMCKAGLLERPQRGYVTITDRSRQALQARPSDMLAYLGQFEEFRILMRSGAEREDEARLLPEGAVAQDGGALTPEELIAQAQAELAEALADELLLRLRQVDPRRFEQIIIDLMEKMHYGTGSLTPGSHDGGIDGIIDQDELGLDKIYIQAKRYAADSRVHGREMQNFVGALAIKPVTRGVFVTTSDFAEEAIRIAREAQGKNIILVDGRRQAALMMKHNVGVQPRSSIIIKKLDEDYFE